MTETILDPATLAKLEPGLVSPLVAYLASEACEVSGETFAVGGGYVSRVAVVEGAGTLFEGDSYSPEDVIERWGAIMDLGQAKPYGSAMEAIQVALAKATSR